MNNIEKRLEKAYSELNINQKYQLLDLMEKKELNNNNNNINNLGKNNKYDDNFMEGLLNCLLDVTTIIAKIFHII